MQRHPALHPLSHQHHDALALCVLVERSLAADSSDENVRRQARKATNFSATEGENHFRLEEEILFPLVERELGGHPLLGRLLQEHGRLRELAALLESAPSLAELLAFVELLREHVRVEEREFFADVQERLGAETLEAAGAEFRTQAIQICVE